MKIHLLEPLRVSKEKIAELAEPLIQAGHEFKYFDTKTTVVQELIERSKEADIVIIGNNPYPAEVIKANPQLKLIDVAFTGVDHVAYEVAHEMGIQIANASGYATTAISELAVGLTLALYRQIPNSDADTRLGMDFPGPFQGMEIKGKTVGIIGTGHIGIETAKLFKAFGAHLIGYSRSENNLAKEIGLEYHSLEEVLEKSDIISIHLPLNDGTKGLLSKEKLELIQDDAILINTARGAIVDNAALAQLLNDSKIAGAGIDVFDMEPPLASDYPLLHAKNTILTPHIAYLSDEAMVKRAEIAFQNVERFIEGKPQNIVK